MVVTAARSPKLIAKKMREANEERSGSTPLNILLGILETSAELKSGDAKLLIDLLLECSRDQSMDIPPDVAYEFGMLHSLTASKHTGHYDRPR